MTINEEPNYEELDPGIRSVVRWLRGYGFETTDSGDGKSKTEAIAAGEALAFPHVFMRVATSQMLAEPDRLQRLCDERGLRAAKVEVSYCPKEDFAILMLADVSDDDLVGERTASDKAEYQLSGYAAVVCGTCNEKLGSVYWTGKCVPETTIVIDVPTYNKMRAAHVAARGCVKDAITIAMPQFTIERIL